MKIYTKTGDGGETSLYRGGRIAKDSDRMIVIGTVDELNCHIGRLRAAGLPDDLDTHMRQVQNDLFLVGADLATPANLVREGDKVSRLASDSERFLEQAIDRMEAELSPLKRFILPGGSTNAADAHVARAVCRRAERTLVALSRNEPVSPAIMVYLNRLSDFLFVAARSLNLDQGVDDEPWENPA